jgi:hypothetical protein
MADQSPKNSPPPVASVTFWPAAGSRPAKLRFDISHGLLRAFLAGCAVASGRNGALAVETADEALASLGLNFDA